jgi:phage shock protein E
MIPIKRFFYILFSCLLGVAVPLAASGTGEAAENRVDYRSPEALEQLIAEETEPYLLVDVRTPDEYNSGFIPSAVNIPVQELPEKLPDVDKESLIILYCRSGNRSATARRIFMDAGFTNVIDFGGINRWPGELMQP